MAMVSEAGWKALVTVAQPRFFGAKLSVTQVDTTSQQMSCSQPIRCGYLLKKKSQPVVSYEEAKIIFF